MGYIKYIREMVGQKPIITCGASVLLFNQEGQLLMQRRKDNNLWGYAGGVVEMDETVENAAKRELYEETGLTALSLELLGVFSGKELHFKYPNGDEINVIDVVFTCKAYEGTLSLQEKEVTELCFFDIDKLPAAIFSPAVPIIKALQKCYRREGKSWFLDYKWGQNHKDISNYSNPRN